jgi:ribulose kinase
MIYLGTLRTNTFVSDDALSVVKRLALILPVLHDFHGNRKFSNKEYARSILFDIDLENAVSLVKTYLQHSIIMF